MDSDLAQEAISAAFSGDWQKAIDLNAKILKLNSTDVDALNRIAKAYVENGNISKAKITTQKVLKIDPDNSIAVKCLIKWKSYKDGEKSLKPIVNPTSFIEEPNKTKIIELINLGDASAISNLSCGDLVKLSAHMHRINVTTLNDKYLGRFPDNLAIKFINLIKNGNFYEAIVKSADKDRVRIFVRQSLKNAL